LAGFPAPRHPKLREVKAPTAVLRSYQWNSSPEALAPLKAAPFQATKFTVSINASSSRPKGLHMNKLGQPSDRSEKLKKTLAMAYGSTFRAKERPWGYKATGFLLLHIFHVLLLLLPATTSLQAHLLLVQQNHGINNQIFTCYFQDPWSRNATNTRLWWLL